MLLWRRVTDRLGNMEYITYVMPGMVLYRTKFQGPGVSNAVGLQRTHSYQQPPRPQMVASIMVEIVRDA
jgi:hypothetical protein